MNVGQRIENWCVTEKKERQSNYEEYLQTTDLK